jgi:preprotein translocase subunit YajC
MPDLLAHLPLLLAQGDAAAPEGGSGGFGLLLLTYVLPISLFFYLLIYRPQQQQARKQREMIDALKKNDRVLTAAGIYGTVVSVDGDGEKVVLRVDDGVKLTFSKSSVVRVVEASSEKPAELAEKPRA